MAKSGSSPASSLIVGLAKVVDGRIASRVFASQMPGKTRGRGSRTTRDLVMVEAKRRRLSLLILSLLRHRKTADC